MRNFVTAACVLLGLAFAGPARAQDFEAAGRHFEAAQKAFSQKFFHTAAIEFQSAYDITKDPVLLYNVGESWEKAGEGRKAATAYKAYLKAQPNAQDRPEVQKRVRAIEAKRYKIPSQASPGDLEAAKLALAPPLPPKPATPVKPVTPPVAATPPAPVKPATPPVATPPAPVKPATPPVAAVTPRPTPPPAPPELAPPPARRPPKPIDTVLPPTEEAPPPPAAALTPAPRPAPPARTGVLDERPASGLRIAAWVGVATTVAVLTAGAVLGLAAQSRADEISNRLSTVDASGQPKTFDAQQQADYQSLRDEGNLYNGLAIGFFSGAGALAITTTVLFLVDWKHHRGERLAGVKLSPTFARDGGGFAASWSF